jgi:hypothetical protein
MWARCLGLQVAATGLAAVCIASPLRGYVLDTVVCGRARVRVRECAIASV